MEVRLGVESQRLGPLGMPSLDASVTERVVLLDSLLYVAQSGESSAVWVRPFVQLSADDDDD
jgi:hypothetical protein